MHEIWAAQGPECFKPEKMCSSNIHHSYLQQRHPQFPLHCPSSVFRTDTVFFYQEYPRIFYFPLATKVSNLTKRALRKRLRGVALLRLDLELPKLAPKKASKRGQWRLEEFLG